MPSVPGYYRPVGLHHVARVLSGLSGLQLCLLVVPVSAVHPLHDPDGLLPLRCLHVTLGSLEQSRQAGLVQIESLLTVLDTGVQHVQLGEQLSSLGQEVGVGPLVPDVNLERLGQTPLGVLQPPLGLGSSRQFSLLLELPSFTQQRLGSLVILVNLENLTEIYRENINNIIPRDLTCWK